MPPDHPSSAPERPALPSVRPPPSLISETVRAALDRGLLAPGGSTGPGAPVAVFFDRDRFAAQLTRLADAFPPPALNALAVKANPLAPLLKVAAARGFGAECASLGELHIAERAGVPAERIVFDSPAKTPREIVYALERGYRLNIDNLQEFERVARLLEEHGAGQSSTSASTSTSTSTSRSIIGLRINPLVGAGRLAAMSTATKTSKFGVTIADAEAYLAAHPETRDWLTGLHLHVGSHGTPLALLVRGVRAVVDLALRLNDRHGFAIRTIDIGGGLSVRYHPDDTPITFAAYAAALRKEIPALARFGTVTEFGRRVSLHAGWTAARVEYTKAVGEHRIAVVQAGAEHFIREAYIDWYHDLLVLDGEGMVKGGDGERESGANTHAWDIAGPLCFSSDYIARGRRLPAIEPGDWLVVRETGAYTFGMFSRYLTRAFPPVYGYEARGGTVRFETLHHGQSEAAAAAFWTGEG